ncbi:MAG TPA: FG-GAP-like repeat-containing protein [Pyrinomonadaceae bacterium]|jgi:hypothetical protein
MRALFALLVIGLIFAARQSASADVNSAPANNLIISEFRLRGPNGANDEFIEIYNNSGADHTVQTSDGSTGYALVASDGMSRFVIPNGTVIPGRGHYLGVNSVGYSLSSYPAGNSTTATGDITYTTDIPDNFGIALFNSANPANWTLTHRLDAVGSSSEANNLYREGTGYPALTPFSIDYSFYRDLVSGFPKDTGVNSSDFVFVDTNGTSAGAGQRLGTPGPENLSSPRRRIGLKAISLLEPAVCPGCPANHFRDFTSDPANNSTFGTISIHRKFTNKTGVPITRLRFRITEIKTFPAPSGTADLRPRTSSNAVVSLSGGGTSTVRGTTLEQPPGQPNGGGFNSSLSVNSVTAANPLAPGASINVRFLLGIQQAGKYVFRINGEALPSATQSVYLLTGDTELGGEFELNARGDYDGDGMTDLAVWKPTTGNWTAIKSAAGPNISQVLGQNGDLPATGDYDRDGVTDLAVFRPADATWHIRRSSNNTTFTRQFGQATDVPAPGDYDGDGKTDIAVYRPSNGTFFYIQSSDDTQRSKKWGKTGDLPAPGNFDNDRKTDFAIFRPSDHTWHVLKSTNNMALTVSVGSSTSVPVPGDYDGNGLDDFALFEPSPGAWSVRLNGFNTVLFDGFGINGDIPQPGDYDGDGRYDFAVWRPSDGNWYVNKSGGGGVTTRKLGGSGDVPVAAMVSVP